MSFFKRVNQPFTENFDIVPFPTAEWTIDPYDEASADGNTNFVAKACLVKLVGPPAFGLREGLLLPDPEVCPINRDQAIVANIINFALLPENLC